MDELEFIAKVNHQRLEEVDVLRNIQIKQVSIACHLNNSKTARNLRNRLQFAAFKVARDVTSKSLDTLDATYNDSDFLAAQAMLNMATSASDKDNKESQDNSNPSHPFVAPAADVFSNYSTQHPSKRKRFSHPEINQPPPNTTSTSN